MTHLLTKEQKKKLKGECEDAWSLWEIQDMQPPRDWDDWLLDAEHDAMLNFIHDKKEAIAKIIREHFDCGTLMPTQEDKIVAQEIIDLLKGE